MAITRAQQARQMLRDGNVAMQGGVKNYLGEQETVSNVPVKWKSGPNKPATELAYITEAEKNLLLKEDIHRSLKDGPNKGPKGIMSLDSAGDAGNVGGTAGGDVSDTVGSTDRGTGDYGVTDKAAQDEYNRNRAIRDFNRRQVENIGKPKSFFSNLPTPLNLAKKLASKFGPLNNLDFYNEKVVPAGKKTFRNYEDYMSQRMAGKIDAYGNDISEDGDGEGGLFAPITSSPPMTTATAATEDPPVNLNRIAYRLMADGGAVMDDEPRQAYGLGDIVKKATRAVKKVVKSDIGKAALLYAATGGLGNLAQGQGFFTNFTSPTTFLGGARNIFTRQGAKNLLFGGEKLLGNPAKGNLVPFSGLIGKGGQLTGMGAARGIAAVSALPLLGVGVEEDEEENEGLSPYLTAGLDIDAIRADPRAAQGRAFRLQIAEGGSTEKKEPVAKKVMPLLDMDGMEKDYRAEGGFVPIGRMEKADDVPARLSKNEFVFTADAVRNAGDGSVDKGAEVMYNMMKNLEAGGEVSEESQGLEGARKMFQTSQRLEEVI